MPSTIFWNNTSKGRDRVSSQSLVEALSSAGGPLCDDCLHVAAGYSSRQAARGAALRLEKDGVLHRGQGRCSACGGLKIVSTPSGLPWTVRQQSTAQTTPVPATTPPRRAALVAAEEQPWYWEGNVQSVVVDHLASRGWRIRRVANTATNEAGIDIVGEREGGELWVTVKGYPVATTKTNAPTQARHWFCGAVFDAVLYRGEREDVDIAIALPDGFVTYSRLASRVTWLKEKLPFRFLWLSENGGVRED